MKRMNIIRMAVLLAFIARPLAAWLAPSAFAQGGGALRAVFMYPAQMTWKECRRLWGMNVNATEAGKGRTFYSYNNRHLDVLVDPDGKVISLGLY